MLGNYYVVYTCDIKISPVKKDLLGNVIIQ